MSRHRTLQSSALALAAVVACGGCLGNAHVIPAAELQRLSQTPPEQRGQRVRVIQGFDNEESAPAAPGVHAETHVVLIGSPVPGPVVGGGGGGYGRGRGLARMEADRSRWWFVLAGITALGLAFTEGARFDGWAQLHPMHPVHLYGPWGYRWVPLAQLDAATAAYTQKAFVRSSEGPFHRLERAPLDREGLTYSLLLGAARIPSVDGTQERGFLGHIQFGAFPTREVGVLLDFGLGWATSGDHYTVFDSRTGIELQVFPVAAGLVHAGAFGEVGFGRRLQDGPGGDGETSLMLGGGGMLQLELTTRLALTARAGVTRVYDETVSDFSVGVSIY